MTAWLKQVPASQIPSHLQKAYPSNWEIKEPVVAVDHLLKPFRLAIFSMQFVDNESFLKKKKKEKPQLIRNFNDISVIIPQ